MTRRQLELEYKKVRYEKDLLVEKFTNPKSPLIERLEYVIGLLEIEIREEKFKQLLGE